MEEFQEILELNKNFGTNFIFFTDLTFNANEKKVTDLCNYLIESKLNISWFATCSVRISYALAKKMKEAGCTSIGIGIETLFPDLLCKYKQMQTLEDIQKCLKM